MKNYWQPTNKPTDPPYITWQFETKEYLKSCIRILWLCEINFEFFPIATIPLSAFLFKSILVESEKAKMVVQTHCAFFKTESLQFHFEDFEEKERKLTEAAEKERKSLYGKKHLIQIKCFIVVLDTIICIHKFCL